MDDLTKRSIDIIKQDGIIVLKKKGYVGKFGYLHLYTNIAAGPDFAVFGRQKSALPFFNLKWAHTIASLYNCNVVIIYPKK